MTTPDSVAPRPSPATFAAARIVRQAPAPTREPEQSDLEYNDGINQAPPARVVRTAVSEEMIQIVGDLRPGDKVHLVFTNVVRADRDRIQPFLSLCAILPPNNPTLSLDTVSAAKLAAAARRGSWEGLEIDVTVEADFDANGFIEQILNRDNLVEQIEKLYSSTAS